MSGKTEDLQVNTKYQYEDSDINAILEARIKQLGKEQNFYCLAAVSNISVPNQVEGQLTTALKSYNAANLNATKKLLVPFNLGNNHWVGIVLDVKDGRLQAVKCIDSLNGAGTINETIKQEIAVVYPEIRSLTIQNLSLLTQTDGTTCGAYTIENLLLAAQNQDKSSLNLTTDLDENQAIRKMHLQTLQKTRKDYFAKFHQKQLNNDETKVININDQLRLVKNMHDRKLTEEQQQRALEIIKLINQIQDLKYKNRLLEAFRFLEQIANEEDANKKFYNKLREVFSEKHDDSNVLRIISELFKNNDIINGGINLEFEQFKFIRQKLSETSDKKLIINSIINSSELITHINGKGKEEKFQIKENKDVVSKSEPDKVLMKIEENVLAFPPLKKKGITDLQIELLIKSMEQLSNQNELPLFKFNFFKEEELIKIFNKISMEQKQIAAIFEFVPDVQNKELKSKIEGCHKTNSTKHHP